MKILIFSQYYYPEQFLINEIAPELKKQGHDVTVLTGLPNYPEGKILQEYKHGKKREEIIDGVHIIRCPIIPRGKNKLSLLLNYFSFMVSASLKSRTLKGNFDVVFLYQLTPITMAYPAIRYCRRKKCRLVSYNLDLAPLSGSKVMHERSAAVNQYARFSRWAMNACDYIAVSSESFLEYNHRVNGVPYEKMEYLPQHAPEYFLEKDMHAIENGVADFMFAGNVARGTGLETLVDAAEILKKRAKFKIHIVGSGTYLENLKCSVFEKKLEDYFVFHGRHFMDEMPQLYEKADALLITLRPGQITVPSKLQTYMTTGKPVFGAMDGSGKDVIEESGCGVCVQAGQGEKLAEKMEEYITHPERFSDCGTNGLRYFKEHYTKKQFMDHLNAILIKNAQKG